MTGVEWLSAPGTDANWEPRLNIPQGLKLRCVPFGSRSDRTSVFWRVRRLGEEFRSSRVLKSRRILSRAVGGKCVSLSSAQQATLVQCGSLPMV